MHSIQPGCRALVVGASGGIGSAIAHVLADPPYRARVTRLSRRTDPEFDLTRADSVERAACRLAGEHGKFDLMFDATGILDVGGTGPEKSLSALDADALAQAFAVNAIGPALLLKHLVPHLPATGRCVFATLSARVGSIGDNHLGGWYAYRAAKAALNQIVRTAAIEIARKRPQAICLALHPGTVETQLSRPHARGRYTHSPDAAARALLRTIDTATPEQSGSFLAYDGSVIAW